MCGIVGLFNMQNVELDIDPIVRAFIERFIVVETLVALLPRGDDASGMAVLWDDQETAVVKQPVESPMFAVNDGKYVPAEDWQNEKDKDAHFMWLMSKWFRKYPDVAVTQVLGHVRKATTGNIYNNHNNHPIIAAPKIGEDMRLDKDIVVGIHNGAIKNHAELFKKHKLPRVGEVDSEVIFQMMAKYGTDLGMSSLEEIYKDLTGAMAVMAYRPDTPFRAFGLKNTQRPLWAAWLDPIGALVLVSEKKYLQKALDAYERWRIRSVDTTAVINTGDSEIDVGSPYEQMPYISPVWAKAEILSGVFTIDLQQDIPDRVDNPNDLLEHKYIMTKTTYATTGTYTYKDRRSTAATATTTTTTASVTTTKTTPSTAPATPKLTDYTDYSHKEQVGVHPIPLPSASEWAEEITEDAEYEIEIETVSPEENDDADVPEEIGEGVPYSWDELQSIAVDLLYGDAAKDTRLLLNTGTESIKDKIRRYVITNSDLEHAVAALYCLYDIVFPEGFAYGFKEGYTTALDEIETVSDEQALEEAEDELSRLRKQVSRLEEELKRTKEKHAKATALVRKFASSYKAGA